jgi:BTG family
MYSYGGLKIIVLTNIKQAVGLNIFLFVPTLYPLNKHTTGLFQYQAMGKAMVWLRAIQRSHTCFRRRPTIGSGESSRDVDQIAVYDLPVGCLSTLLQTLVSTKTDSTHSHSTFTNSSRMHIEIVQAAEFLCRLLLTKLDPDPLSKFKDRLVEVLKSRYADHWDTTQPYRGNAYRAISNFSGVMDDALLAGK